MSENINPQVYTPYRRSNKIRIKTLFVSSVLRETALKIRGDQQQVVDDWNLFESGRLKKWMVGHFSVANQEGGAKLSMRYLNYARFLDMYRPWIRRGTAKRDAYHLYNKLIFGHLYNYTLPELSFGFTEEVSAEVEAKLIAIMEQKMPFYKMQDEKIKAIGSENRNLGAMAAKSLRRGYGF